MQILATVVQVILIYLFIGLVITSSFLGLGWIEITKPGGFWVGVTLWFLLVYNVVKALIKRNG